MGGCVCVYIYIMHSIYYLSIQITFLGFTSWNKNRALPTPYTHRFIISLLIKLSFAVNKIYHQPTHILGDTPNIHPLLRAPLFEPVHTIRISATLFSGTKMNSQSM